MNYLAGDAKGHLNDTHSHIIITTLKCYWWLRRRTKHSFFCDITERIIDLSALLHRGIDRTLHYVLTSRFLLFLSHFFLLHRFFFFDWRWKLSQCDRYRSIPR